MRQGDASQEYAAVAEFYDHVDAHRDRPDVEFYVEAAVRSGGPVLELGSGTGRVLLPIARSNVEIVGLDLSPHMLRVCRDRLAREPEDVRARVTLHEGDMKNFALHRRFALIITPFRSFQHLTAVANQMSCLKSARRHMVPGGTLILDVFNPSLETLVADNLGQEFGEEPEFDLPDGRRVLRRDRHVARDPLRQTIDVELIYYVTFPNGRQERVVHSFVMRYFYRYEAEHLLARCGFEVQRIYADYHRNPYGSKYPGELIIVATAASA